jgi:hypothetical protein
MLINLDRSVEVWGGGGVTFLEITANKLRARYALYNLCGYEVLGTYFPHVSCDALGTRCHASTVSDFVEQFSLLCTSNWRNRTCY